MALEQWVMSAIRDGLEVQNEANTSRYVHEALRYCFNWPFEAIKPQASKRGFIDYKLVAPESPISIRVEVKPFQANLAASMIQKYIVRKGRDHGNFRMGVLTNLEQWQVFLAGPRVTKVTGRPLTKIFDTKLHSYADFRALRHLIGYDNAPDFESAGSALGQEESVISHMLCTDNGAINAVRTQLKNLLKQSDSGRQTPQFSTTARAIKALVSPKKSTALKFDVALFQRAIRSPPVAEAINNELMIKFGARNQQRLIRSTLKNIFD